MNFVQAHELLHRMDILEYHSLENEKFIQVIENTRKKVYDNSDKIAEWFSVGGGHRAEYWREDSTYVCLEIFANMGAIEVIDYKSKEVFNGILKEVYEAYKELVK